MHLPLHYAASIPVAITALVGFSIPFLGTKLFRMPSLIADYPPVLTAIFSGIAALLLVVPNVCGAAAANRFSNGRVLAFVGAFAATFIAVWLMQAFLIDRLFATKGGMDLIRGPAVWVVVLADILVCCGIAASVGRSTTLL